MNNVLYTDFCTELYTIQNKTKLIRADLLDLDLDLDLDFEDPLDFVIFYVWYHFSFGNIAVLVTFQF